MRFLEFIKMEGITHKQEELKKEPSGKFRFFGFKGFISRVIPVFFFLTVFAAPSLHARIVSEIIIEGNNRVSQKEILKNISMKAGEEFSARKAGDDISSIYEMGKFDNVSVVEEEVDDELRIIYEVEEKPLIKNIEFRGNEEISSRRLNRQMELQKGDYFDEHEMQRGERALNEFYRERGYAGANVEGFLSRTEDNQVEITYYVEEGNKIKVQRFNVFGVLRGDFNKVKDQLELKKGDVYQQNKLDESIANIRRYYMNEGFINADVSDPVLRFCPERQNIFISVFVTENERYEIGAVNFFGNIRVDDDILKNVANLSEGMIYSQQNIEMAMASIQEVYGEKGYIRVAAIPHFDFRREEKRVNINFEIQEGPKVYVRNVYIQGNHVTRDYVIRREIGLEEGDVFNLSQVRRAQARIYRTGFFRDVQMELLPADTADKTDIVFIVEEQKTGMVSLGAGWSSQDRLVGSLQVSQDNLFGRGQNIRAMWEFGRRKQDYRIDFSEPWLFNTPTPFSFSVYNTIRTRRYKDTETGASGDYDERRSGGSLSLGRHLTDAVSARLRYTYEQVGRSNISASIKDFVDEETDSISSLTPRLSYDTRDYPFDPSTGVNIRLSNQVAGGILGGDNDFVKSEFGFTYFQPLFWEFVGVANLEIGHIAAYGRSDDVPHYEKFNVGGAESIRGYEYYGDIGPSGGGKYKAVGNLEVKFPIFQERGQTVLQGALFYDIGGAWDKTDDITLRTGDRPLDLKRGFGVGIRFKMPGFPIRLDWGYGMDKETPGGQWYFTLGDIF